VAIGTVTKAVDLLRSEGLVVTVLGRGVWVTDRR
jgi:DNA-binding GntR family transcriptional regulator